MSVEQPRMRVFTIGHSNRTFDEFLTILSASSIRLIVDIRSNPVSTRFPQYERHTLSNALQRNGLSYRWMRELGGRQPKSSKMTEHTTFSEEWMARYAAAMNTARFQQAVETTVGLAASAVSVLLCAERRVSQCHRQLLADKLTVMGLNVVHLIDPDQSSDHVLHPDLVFEAGKMVYRRKQLDLI